MEKITQVKVLDGYRLEILFTDGVHGVVSLSDRLFGPVFEPLKDLKLFAQASKGRWNRGNGREPE